MSDTPITAQQVLEKLRARAAEHDDGHEADQEYAAGIRDAITALEPFIKTVCPEVVGYLNGAEFLRPDEVLVAGPNCEPLGRIQVAK